VGAEVVVVYFFAFAYDIAGVELVFVDDVVFVYDVVPVFDYVFVPNDPLGARTIEYLPFYRFLAATVAAACAIAIHVFISFANNSTCFMVCTKSGKVPIGTGIVDRHKMALSML